MFRCSMGLIQTNAAELDKFTQEFQLTSQSESTLEWVAGVYYTRETASINQRYENFVYDGSALGIDSELEELALFGTFTYKFTPQFDVAFGLRAARNEQRAVQHGEGMFVSFESREDSSEDVLLYSIAPRWRPSDATTVYMRVASGYRPGGPNIIPVGNPASAPRSYDSDSVLSFEAGVKTDLLDRSMSLDLSAFFLRWKDLQLTGIVNDTSVMSNAGEAESRGIEWDVELRPFEGFTVNLIGAYTDAALTESTATGTDVDLLNGREGDPLPYVAKWTALVGVNYEWPLSGTAIAYVGANWNYIDERRTDFGSEFGHQLTLPSYDTTDVRFGVDFQRWSIGFYGKNLTDERGIAALSESNSRQGGGVYDPDAFSWAFAVDAQRRRRQPRQQHLAGRGVDADRAAQDLAGVGQLELRLAPHRHVEAFEPGELRQRARQPARHQPLHGDRELQALGVLVLVGAEIERPGTGRATRSWRGRRSSCGCGGGRDRCRAPARARCSCGRRCR